MVGTGYSLDEIEGMMFDLKATRRTRQHQRKFNQLFLHSRFRCDELSRMPLSSQQENDGFDGPDDRRNETKKVIHVRLAYPVKAFTYNESFLLPLCSASGIVQIR